MGQTLFAALYNINITYPLIDNLLICVFISKCAVFNVQNISSICSLCLTALSVINKRIKK